MIRKIKESDREIFLKFAKTMYMSDAVAAPIPESRHVAAFNEMMRSEDYLLGLIVECDGKPVGYGLCSKMYSQEAGGISLWIEEVYILPEYRSRGLGRELFAYVEKIPGIARLRLEVDAENTRAIDLYVALGFSDVPYHQLMKDFL